MADLGVMFDAKTIDPSKPLDPLPAGKYLAQITDSEMKDAKSGLGKYLKLTFEVVDGPYRGRKCWAQLNILNQNQTASEIARRELSAIAHAVGVMTFRDSAALHNLPLVIHVKCKTREDTGTIQNEVTGFEAKEALLAPPAVSSAQSVVDTPPWQR